MFSPVYILDSCLQSADGAGPKIWEPCSRMGVYLGHSPFHAGSVPIFFNPLTGRVSTKYHLVFYDEFPTVTYMEVGAVPPNWPALVKYSSERATNEDFSLSETWSPSNSNAITDPANDPFAIVVPDHSNTTPLENAQVSLSLSPDTIVTSVTKRKSSSVSSCKKGMKLSIGDRVGAYQYKRISIPTTQQMPVTTSVDELRTPPQLNSYNSGLHRSSRIHKLDQQEKY